MRGYLRGKEKGGGRGLAQQSRKKKRKKKVVFLRKKAHLLICTCVGEKKIVTLSANCIVANRHRMKIIGFAYIDGKTEMLLKGDSSLLNNRKPMFIPDWTSDMRFTPAIVLRVSRLGKNIATRFGNRYYDAMAPAADFTAYDCLSAARQNGESWTRATGFDFSLSVGEFGEESAFDWSIESAEGICEEINSMPLIISAEEAIHQASEVMTIRQGDLIYIQQQTEGRCVATNQTLHATLGKEDKLYCKIK